MLYFLTVSVVIQIYFLYMFQGELPAAEKMNSLNTGLFGVIIVPIVLLVVVGVITIVLIMRHRRKTFLQCSRVSM